MRKEACGSYWMSKRLRRFLSSRYNASCIIHDLDYESEKYSQKEADERFLKHMLKQVKGKVFPTILAYCFYAAVRIGGKLSYGKKYKN